MSFQRDFRSLCHNLYVITLMLFMSRLGDLFHLEILILFTSKPWESLVVDPRVLLGSPCLYPIGYLGYPEATLACEPNGLCQSQAIEHKKYIFMTPLCLKFPSYCAQFTFFDQITKSVASLLLLLLFILLPYLYYALVYCHIQLGGWKLSFQLIIVQCWQWNWHRPLAVSYTHLTLPTKA